jgi:putative lipoic acid-binding regulatory protein
MFVNKPSTQGPLPGRDGKMRLTANDSIVPEPDTLSEDEVLGILEGSFAFPGFFPVVVIARRETTFDLRLHTALAEAQGEAPFKIEERLSKNGNYVSYHVEVFVDDARTALARKGTLATLPGVLMLL